MTAFTIRRATLDDVAAAAPLFDQYRQFYREPSDIALAQRYLHARLARDESVLLLAELADGSLAGFCQLYPGFCSLAAAPIFVLYDLYTAPQQRQRGIAGGLLTAAAQHARDCGHVRLELSTARDNLAAQALYHAHGWVRDDVYLHYSKDVSAG